MSLKVRRIIGDQPHPRALFLGIDPIETGLKDLFISTRRIQDLSEVRQADYDILVTSGPVYAEDSLFVVAFGGRFGSMAGVEAPAVSAIVGYASKSNAMELIAPELPDHLTLLVERELEPEFAKMDTKEVLTFQIVGFGTSHTLRRVQINDPIRAFLLTGDGGILAGSFQRDEQANSHIWCLPHFAIANAGVWVRAAINEWHALDPRRFPLHSPLHEQPEWMTPEELHLMAELQKIKESRRSMLTSFETKEHKLKQGLTDARSRADAGRRLLLTATGPALEVAVLDALKVLGFDVEEMDALVEAGKKVEDLRVADTDAPNWVALAEVKGYSNRSAKSSDLQKIQRFVSHFTLKEQRIPDAVWYVVNQYAGAGDPTTRPTPLATQPEDLQAFAESGGLVIDTAELFRLVTAVEQGQLEARDARAHMRNSVGTYSCSEQLIARESP